MATVRIGGRFAKTRPAIERFAEKCRFDPLTGCVLWAGGRTRGRGNTAEYGSFWYEGRRWFAHRWAAVHIHDLPLGRSDQVGHCCPAGPFTLCVEHVEGTTTAANMAEQYERLGNPRHRNGPCEQSALDRQRWLLVERGYEEPPPMRREPGDIPWYEPPAWFAPFVPKLESAECPF